VADPLGIVFVTVSLGICVGLLVFRTRELHQARAMLQRRAQEMTLLNNIGQFTADNLNLDDVLWNIYEHIAHLMNVSIFYIALYDVDSQMLDYKLAVADGKRIEWRPRKVSGAAEYIIQHKKPLRINASQRAADPRLQNLTPTAPYLDYLGVPLLVGARVVGVMSVLSTVREDAYGETEIQMLQTVASQVGLVVRNAALYTRQTELVENLSRINESVKQSAYEMSQLVQLSRISTSSLSLSAVTRDIADMLQQMTGANRVGIFLLEDDVQRMRLLATANGSVSEGSSGYPDSLPELGRLASEAATGIAAYHHTDKDLSPALVQQMSDYHERSIALIPLVADNRMLGAVLLGSLEQRQFETHERQLIETAVNQIAGQINNIRLHEKIQQDLNRRLAQVGVIEDIAKQVSSSLDFNQIINHVLNASMKATDADLGVLALATDNDQMWLIEQRIQDGVTHGRYQSRAKETGLPGYVIREGRAVILPDNQSAPYYQSDYGTEYCSSLGVPLMKASDTIGALLVESKRINAFNSEQAGFLTSLAGHAVMSIENARFIEDRQHEISLLKSLRELALWLASADDTRSVGHEILETALQLLQGKQAALYEYKADQLRTLARLWYSESRNVHAEENLPCALAEEAVSKGDLAHLADVREHPAYTDTPGFDYDSAVAIPIKHARQVRYVLLLTFEGHRQLIERDLNTIDLLAGQAIGHLENASLHERIRAGRDQMRAILNSTRDGLILLDGDANLIEANPSANRLLGFDLEPFLGQYFPDVITKHIEEAGDSGYTAQDVANLVMTLRLQPGAETRSELHRQLGNRILYIEEVQLPVRDEMGTITGRLLALRDVTEARLLDEQREDFTDMVIHDLRGPLGAIQNAVHLVLPRLGSPEDVEDNTVLLKSSAGNAARLLRLVETLLDISKMQRARLELKREPVALRTLVASASGALLTTAQRSNIVLHSQIPDDLPLLYVDCEQVERILINLLDNAVRYSPAGGEIRISAHVSEVGKWVEVRFADSGPGIPSDRRSEIFERFRRIPGQQPQRGHRGHGLGLNFVKMAVEQHGGSILVTDDPDLPGACFVFTLPIAN
jgi:two-component system phosphate regulon sensor histidine kinase PhoR